MKWRIKEVFADNHIGYDDPYSQRMLYMNNEYSEYMYIELHVCYISRVSKSYGERLKESEHGTLRTVAMIDVEQRGFRVEMLIERNSGMDIRQVLGNELALYYIRFICIIEGLLQGIIKAYVLIFTINRLCRAYTPIVHNYIEPNMNGLNFIILN